MEQIQDRVILGLKAAPFGVGEPLLGKSKGSQIDEGLAGVIEAFEPVNYFEKTVLPGRDADGQFGS